MEITLDHIVHFIGNDPQHVVHTFQNKGIHAVAGGSHKNWGTYNSLLYSGLAYIEFLAIEHAEIAAKSDNPLVIHLRNTIKREEGIGQICFRTEHIDKLQQHLHNLNLKTLPIFHGSRIRQDGKQIEWKMLFIEDKDPYIPLPFFIEWKENDESRLAELKTGGFVDSNLENSQIKRVEWPVTDYKKAALSWSSLFGEQMYMNDTLKKVRIMVGNTEICFTSQDTNRTSKGKQYKVILDPPLIGGPICVNGVQYE
ncbi:VOC family protein [Cytobacillus gottheilii]|uniref:VOC family protein n=1 Tax=Cytobacillus gottheilii TaxID=859144 RepID=UPI0009B9C944|nr:VOC family protein [Cytobacillus gottheilii]